MIVASKAQLRANKRWKHKNKLRNRKNNYKSACKNYILNWSTRNDLNHRIPAWMQIRKDKLNK